MAAKGRTVMVVDDDPGFLEFMSYLLRSEHYEVVLQDQGTTAMEKIRRRQPDLIILDLAMPEKTGWALLEELKSNDATRSIPVIICTAAVQEAERRRSLTSALNVRTIMKPFDVNDLLALLSAILEERLVEPVTGSALLNEKMAGQNTKGQGDYDVSSR